MGRCVFAHIPPRITYGLSAGSQNSMGTGKYYLSAGVLWTAAIKWLLPPSESRASGRHVRSAWLRPTHTFLGSHHYDRQPHWLKEM